MPSGVGLELIIVAALLGLLLLAFIVGRRMRRPPTAKPARAEGLGDRARALLGREPTDDAWRRLQETLVRSDTGTRAARELVTRVREAHEPGADPEPILVREMAGMFEGDPGLHVPDGLAVILVVGVNGTGKTTTIGKLAKMLAGRGRSVAVAASDTYRAGAVSQLATWAQRAGADVVTQERGADPGAVAHDAVTAARARGKNVLIVDTAGRIHTRQPLMDEVSKVKRVLENVVGKVDEVLLVVDATTGQNGIAQARTFLGAVGVTGIALTKLDGTAKGGVVLAIREELGVPVKLVGTGEKIEDLEEFDAQKFARSLVAGS